MEYQYTVLLIILFQVVLAHVVAKYVGEPRYIGYGKSVFWSILFTPIIGYFITLTSPKRVQV